MSDMSSYTRTKVDRVLRSPTVRMLLENKVYGRSPMNLEGRLGSAGVMPLQTHPSYKPPPQSTAAIQQQQQQQRAQLQQRHRRYINNNNNKLVVASSASGAARKQIINSDLRANKPVGYRKPKPYVNPNNRNVGSKVIIATAGVNNNNNHCGPRPRKNIQFYDVNKVMSTQKQHQLLDTGKSVTDIRIVPNSKEVNNKLTAWGTKIVPVVQKLTEYNLNLHTKILFINDDIKLASISKWVSQVNAEFIFTRTTCADIITDQLMQRLMITNNFHTSSHSRSRNLHE